MTKNNREKFKRLAEQRTNKIIRTLRSLGNLANKSNYSYDRKDTDKIFSAIGAELKACRVRFNSENTGRAEDEFKLD